MTPDPLNQRLQAALGRATAALLAARTPAGPWVGSLSSSALSTATAVCALAVVEREQRAGRAGAQAPGTNYHVQTAAGLEWLARRQNADGGWGDTTLSVSNLSTSALCWAAFGAVPGADAAYRALLDRAEQWITRQAGGISPEVLAPAIIRRYGKDRTFSVPILTLCALAGRLGPGRAAWRHVIPLPFELAALPASWFAALRLPVVSYALPALIAMGQARHWRRPTRNPLARLLRGLLRGRTLEVLTRLQPANGGFLEATPLTSFVVMSLAGSALVAHPVVNQGLKFLLKSQRSDGSWPIDTNLATWVTTLALNALGEAAAQVLSAQEQSALASWLLAQQSQREHPYTHAAPGGWAWTDLPGGVPDADDTAGALLALRKLLNSQLSPAHAAWAGLNSQLSTLNSQLSTLNSQLSDGLTWLLDLQNKDGGLPTFCRGWGALPFDRSSPDLTAHALAAWQVWREALSPPLQRRISTAMGRALDYLQRTQRPNGSWVPLWFGNQRAPEEENPTYGTARVLRVLAHLETTPTAGLTDTIEKATQWLVGAQNTDGSWGGAAGCPGSVEETALAVQALAAVGGVDQFYAGSQSGLLRAAVERGTLWLLARIESNEWTQPAPIGFYFARLWYYERLYPVIFTVGALREARAFLG
jgi:squalene-hopene/tetraprenyl-beta-curcumene cyclase